MSQSLLRAIALLERVAAGTATLGELAEAEGVHKSTVLRLLRVLEDSGYVQRTDDFRYSLGPGLFRLAQQALDDIDVRALAAPRLRRLRDEVGQTVHVAAFDGRTATYVDKLEPRDAAVRMASRIGSPAALHCTAVGKVFLAALPLPEREALADALDYPRLTPNTLTSPRELLAAAAEVAERGWAYDDAENETFINCVGAPVLGPGGRVLAAVSISVPDVLLPRDAVHDLVPQLLSATREVSRACGYLPAPPTEPEPDPEPDIKPETETEPTEEPVP
ncbi:IclR family transcriptional regulator [Kineococcus sp. SYSU DK002]|uniref:IclR family transcriptional regulator n=1 Tax=Kineococcus sp. SYSU DK002 TaxID=3383123 RepID=UPI003D7CD9E6